MWKCKHCSEQIENEFDCCWKCGFTREGLPFKATESNKNEPFLSSGELLSQRVAAEASKPKSDEIKEQLYIRYRNAYSSAHGLIRFGLIYKWLSCITAAFIFILGWVLSKSLGELAFLLGLVAGGVIAAPNFLLGMLIAGQGHTQMASLDTAVNTSRHLSREDAINIILR